MKEVLKLGTSVAHVHVVEKFFDMAASYSLDVVMIMIN